MDTSAGEKGTGADVEGVGPLAYKVCEGRVDLAFRAGVENDQVAPDSTRGRLRLSDLEPGTRKVWIDEQGHRGNVGY